MLSYPIWQELINIALIGTERKSLPPLKAGGGLGDMLSQLDTSDQERLLLTSSAILSLYLTVGRMPEDDSAPLSTPCEVDDLPRCGSRASRHLDSMLNGEYPECLQEWLKAAASAGKRVPEDKLPRLLDEGRKKSELREDVVPALGKRGVWLAAQNPEWGYVAGDVDESEWDTGNRAERLKILKQVRDIDPDRGREMLVSSWASESPENKATFIEALSVGLGSADKEFLEQVLDDRRKEVRRAAAETLSRLPESGLVQRTMRRLRQCISFAAGQKARFLIGGKKAALQVTLPETCDRDMVRDGVDQKPTAGSELGEKAWWLKQMLGYIPPSYWCREYETNAAELIGAAEQSEWAKPLIEGWALAATRHRDGEWLENILRMCWGKKGCFLEINDMVEAMPPERLEAYISSNLGSRYTLTMLSMSKHQWSVEFSRTILRWLKPDLSDRGRLYSMPAYQLRPMAFRMSPTIYKEAESHLKSILKDKGSQNVFEENLLEPLKFRHDMLEALRSER